MMVCPTDMKLLARQLSVNNFFVNLYTHFYRHHLLVQCATVGSNLEKFNPTVFGTLRVNRLYIEPTTISQS